MGHGMWGSMPRHHTAMMSGIPAPYNALRNPLPRTRATVERGQVVYDSNCASCHGPNGAGDGEAGKGLNPPPGNLAWLSQMPMVRVGSVHVLDRRRGRGAVRHRDARVQGYAVEGRHLGGRRLHPGADAAKGQVTVSRVRRSSRAAPTTPNALMNCVEWAGQGNALLETRRSRSQLVPFEHVLRRATTMLRVIALAAWPTFSLTEAWLPKLWPRQRRIE